MGLSALLLVAQVLTQNTAIMAGSPPRALTLNSSFTLLSGTIAQGSQCTGDALQSSEGTSVTFARSTTKFCTRSDGVLVSVAADEPAVETNGINIEPAATNLVLQSQTLDVDASGWTFGALTVTANNVAAPDGTTTAERLNITSGSAIHRILPDASAVLTGTYVLSAYVKMGTGIDWARLYPSSSITAQFSVDLNTCVAGTVSGGAVVATGVEALADGWCRFWLAYTGDGVNSQRPIINFGTTDAQTAVGTSWNAAGTETVYVWGVQHEANFLTSYIPTTTAQVARGADNVSLTPPVAMGTAGCVSAVATFRSLVNANGRLFGTSDTSAPAIVATATSSKIADGANTQTLNHSSIANSSVAYRAWWSAGSSLKNIIVGATEGTPDTFDGQMNMGTVYLGSRAATNDYLYGHLKSIMLSADHNGCM